MVLFLCFLSILSKIIDLSNASFYVTGSEDGLIKLWNETSIVLSQNISSPITCLEIENVRNLIIAGTVSGKLVGWNLINNSINFDNGNETTEVKSIVLFNSTHFLAGYNQSVIFWTIPELKQSNKIVDSRLGYIREMKYFH